MRDIDTFLKKYFPDPMSFRSLLKNVNAVLMGDIVSEYTDKNEIKVGGSRICFLPSNDKSSVDHIRRINAVREYLLSVGAKRDAAHDFVFSADNSYLCRCGCYGFGFKLDCFELHNSMIEIIHQDWNFCVDETAYEVYALGAPMHILTHYGSYALHVDIKCSGIDVRSLSRKKMLLFYKRSPRLALEYIGPFCPLKLRKDLEDIAMDCSSSHVMMD
jgi:hypothetical protein